MYLIADGSGQMLPAGWISGGDNDGSGRASEICRINPSMTSELSPAAPDAPASREELQTPPFNATVLVVARSLLTAYSVSKCNF